MAIIQHADLKHDTGAGHEVHAFEFSDPASRIMGLGYTFVETDIKRIAMQTSDHTLWVLTAIEPIAWAPLTAIYNNSITNAKLDNMPANTIKGNDTGSTASADDLTVSDVKTMLGISNVNNTSDADKPVSSATQTGLNAKAPIANPTFTGTVAGISKSMVGLSSVDNTADADKPVSSATQTALNGKSGTGHTHTATNISDSTSAIRSRATNALMPISVSRWS